MIKVEDLMCRFLRRNGEWVCSRCGAAVPGESQPNSVCPSVAASMGVSYAEMGDIIYALQNPRQSLRQVSSKKPEDEQKEGVGYQLKSMLSKIGIRATGNCACNSRSKIMDQWGPDECERRSGEIIDWLRDEAAKRGLPFSATLARMMLNRAISKARKAKKEREEKQSWTTITSESTERDGYGGTAPSRGKQSAGPSGTRERS